jgi:hypothetical protein
LPQIQFQIIFTGDVQMPKKCFNPLLLLVTFMLIIPLLIASCGSSGNLRPSPVETIGPLGQAFQTHLLLVKDAVADMVDPETGEPVSIPDFDLFFESAGRLDTSQTPARDLATIRALLGRATDVDCKEPDADYQLEFPRDHHMNSEMGFEWYYVGFHLDATDPDGTQGRIAVLFSMQKERTIGLTTQKKLKWNDNDCMLFVNLATATVDFPENKSITRRSENLQLTAAGGKASYSSPGEKFHFECGPDKISGTENVLPLDISIQDGNNLSFSFTVIPPDGFEPENAFFLQGIPDNTGSGTGITYLPTPGIYYSWPQLKIDTSKPASIVVDGITYTINSGSGWMDHQVMMKSLHNYGGAVSPVPFIECPKPYNGWSWQFFNLVNGDAFTGASFHHGEIKKNVDFSYGYYIAADPVLGKWTSVFITGDMQMNDFQSFPAIVDDPTSSSVMLPTSWKYENIQSFLGNPLSGIATPWIKDGTFNGQAGQTIGENPVDYKDTSGNHPDGTGFCESIGFEKIENFRKRGIDFLTR